jgi:hypothetical protein
MKMFQFEKPNQRDWIYRKLNFGYASITFIDILDENLYDFSI